MLPNSNISIFSYDEFHDLLSQHNKTRYHVQHLSMNREMTKSRVMLLIAYTPLLFIGISGNTWVATVIIRTLHRSLRTRTPFGIQIYILALCCCDTVALGFLVFLLLDLVYGCWIVPSSAICQLYLASECLNKFCAPFILTCMSGYCYFTVCRRRNANGRSTKKGTKADKKTAKNRALHNGADRDMVQESGVPLKGIALLNGHRAANAGSTVPGGTNALVDGTSIPSSRTSTISNGSDTGRTDSVINTVVTSIGGALHNRTNTIQNTVNTTAINSYASSNINITPVNNTMFNSSTKIQNGQDINETKVSHNQYNTHGNLIILAFLSLRKSELTLSITLVFACVLAALILIAPVYQHGGIYYLLILNDSIITDIIPKCVLQPPEEILAPFTWYSFVLGYIIPAILFTCFYAAIFCKAHSRKCLRSNAPLYFWRVAKTCLILVLFYLICWTPYWSMSIHSFLFPVINSNTYHQDEVMLSYVLHMLPYINCTGYPILYTFLNRSIKAAYNQIIEDRKKRKREKKSRRLSLANRHRLAASTAMSGSSSAVSASYHSAETNPGRTSPMVLTHMNINGPVVTEVVGYMGSGHIVYTEDEAIL